MIFRILRELIVQTQNIQSVKETHDNPKALYDCGGSDNVHDVYEPNAIMDVQLYKTEDGGILESIDSTEEDRFSCFFRFGDFDLPGSLLLNDIGIMKPGEFKANVPVDLACISNIHLEQKVLLYDGVDFIGEATIKEIINPPKYPTVYEFLYKIKFVER